MTFTIDSLPIPPAGLTVPDTEVSRTSGDYDGVARIARCLNTMLAQHVGVVVNDPVRPIITAALKGFYRIKNPYKLGWPTSACQLRVRYKYLRTDEPTWTLTVTCRRNDGTTVDSMVEEVGGSTAAGSGWRVFGDTLTWDDSEDYFDVEVVMSAANGLTEIIEHIVMEVVPPTSVLPTVVGGYTGGVNPLNITVDTASEKFLSTYFLRDMHKMAEYLYTRRPGMILTSSMELFDGAGNSLWVDPAPPGFQWARFKWSPPAGVTSATVWVRDSGTVPLWQSSTVNVSTYPQLFEVFNSNASNMNSICMWWDDAEYP